MVYLNQDEIKDALTDFERRQTGNFLSLMQRVEKQGQNLDVLMRMLDLFLKSYLLHTPPISEDLQEKAKSLAKVRYEKLMQTIAYEESNSSESEKEQ